MDIELLYSGSRFALKKRFLSLYRQHILPYQIHYYLSFISSLLSHKAQIQSNPFRVLQLINLKRHPDGTHHATPGQLLHYSHILP